MKASIIGVLLVVAGAGAPAIAGAQSEPPSPRGADCFSEQDADGDGRVTLLEARAAALVLFERFDRNADGHVTRDEAISTAPSVRRERFESRFLALDRDRDGGLSPWEIRLPQRRFARADRDGDARLSRRELSAMSERNGPGGLDTTALRSMFWRRDLNRDGHVTRSESLAAADRRFMRKDRDRDGVLTRFEGLPPQPRRQRR